MYIFENIKKKSRKEIEQAQLRSFSSGNFFRDFAEEETENEEEQNNDFEDDSESMTFVLETLQSFQDMDDDLDEIIHL